MKTIRLAMLSFCIFSFGILCHAWAASSPTATDLNHTGTAPIAARDSQLQIIIDQLAEVRRDQLNYRIEKNLLKDTYASQLQNVNLVIAVVLGAASFFGFFGLRDINLLKREYVRELDELRKLRSDFESQIGEMQRAKEKIGQEIKDIQNSANNTDRRIQIIELQEKAEDALERGNYDSATRYASVGLDTEPNNPKLLWVKASALCRSDDFVGSLAALKAALGVDPNDLETASSAIEIAALLGDGAFYKEAMPKYRQKLAAHYAPELLTFLDVLASYRQEGAKATISKIKAVYSGDDTAQRKRVPNWNFNDSERFLSAQAESAERDTMLEFCRVFSGTMSPKDAEAKLVQRGLAAA